MEVLSGERATELYLSGRETWNEWVKNNPTVQIDFSTAVFTNDSQPDSLYISFRGFHFPEGGVIFHGAVFIGRADFRDTVFLGFADFANTRFRHPANFSGAKFNHDVSFSDAEFEKRVIFTRTRFFRGHIDFTDTKLRGRAEFDRSKFFSETYAEFRYTEFHKVAVFNNSRFRGRTEFSAYFEDSASFYLCVFRGSIAFGGSRFVGRAIFANSHLKCDCSFDDIQFNNNVFFDRCRLYGYSYSFRRTDFKKRSSFLKLQNTTAAKDFTFNSATFESSFVFEGEFNCIVDFLHTKTANHISLHNLKCNLELTLGGIDELWTGSVKAENATAKLRRLKQIAVENKDPDQALIFNADELRSKRWNESGFIQSLLNMSYSGVSNYGQSIFGPLITLCILLVAFTFTYIAISTTSAEQLFHSALQVSLSNTFPFIPGMGDFRSKGIETLFNDHRPLVLTMIMLFQGIISPILIFLTGLGLRNHFRL